MNAIPAQVIVRRVCEPQRVDVELQVARVSEPMLLRLRLVGRPDEIALTRAAAVELARQILQSIATSP